MKPFPTHRRAGAFTLVELLTVIAIIGILAALLLPALSRSQMRAKRIVCVSDLGQLGIALQIFMHDHASKFPAQVPISDGGSEEFVANGYAVGGDFYFTYRHFLVLSNELAAPKILLCPADTRFPAAKMSSLSNSNLSYFVGVNADYSRPETVVVGDRNIANASWKVPTIVHGGTGNFLRWTKELHESKGNVLLADGHVEEWTAAQVAASPANAGQTADYFLPTILPTQSRSGQTTYGSSGGGSYGGGYGSSPRYSPTTVSPYSGGYGSPPVYKNPTATPTASSQPASGNLPSYSSSPSQNNASGVQQSQGTSRQTPQFATNYTRRYVAVTNVPVVATNKDDAAELATFDQHIVKTLKPVMEWGYLLLLILALLLLLLEIRRRALKKKKRKSGLKR
jgi:prepilin-type N-terminal cleavage/methylation domain-containing protein/prepilin-type processing-associated H-X9-DG protein